MKIFFCILLLTTTAYCGCAPKEYVQEMQYPLRGKCWAWNKVEKQAKNKERCDVVYKFTSVQCTRQKGHSGYHHHHEKEDCQWTWR